MHGTISCLILPGSPGRIIRTKEKEHDLIRMTNLGYSVKQNRIEECKKSEK